MSMCWTLPKFYKNVSDIEESMGRGVQYLMGENLIVFWAQFSTLSSALLLCDKENTQQAYSHVKLKTRPRFSPR